MQLFDAFSSGQSPASFYNEGNGSSATATLTAFRPNSWYHGNQRKYT